MTGRRRQVAAIAAAAAAVIMTAAFFVSAPVSADVESATAQAIADAEANVLRCQAALDAGGLTTAERNEATRCVRINAAALRQLQGTPAPTVTASPSTAPSSPPPVTTLPPTPTPPATTVPPTTSPAGSQQCAPWPAFPDAACTGVPVGVTLTAYTGPCTITVANTVVEAKAVNCVLRPMAAGIVIRDSRIVGGVYGGTGAGAAGFSIVDSEVIAPQVGSGAEANGIGEANFTALRVEVTGGNRGVYCRFNCVLRDSWVHGTNISPTSNAHASAVRQSQGNLIVHNRLHCSAENTSAGGGCSADLTGYGDFEPVVDNRVEKNLFVATPGGACAYGGSSGDDGNKPYGHLARNIVFVDNVFERGPVGDGGRRNCGYYFPITDFDSSRPGSLWQNNRWDSGELVPPAN